MLRCHARLALVAVASLGCDGTSGTNRSPEVLRVSAGHGLDTVGPSPQGSSAHVGDLVYDKADEHVRVVRIDGTTVTLELLDPTESPAELAATVRAKGLVEVEVIGRRILLRYDSLDEASKARSIGAILFERGPYRVAEESPERLVLVPRPGRRGPPIELVSVPAGEQWRRLMARDVDVAPLIPGRYREQFAGLRSVRLVELPVTSVMSLYANGTWLKDSAGRKALFSRIDVRAVAAEACGATDCVPDTCAVDYRTREGVGLPQRVRIAVLADDSEAVVGAEVIRHQLGRSGIGVDIEELPLDQLVQRAQDGDYELAISPRSSDLRVLKAVALLWYAHDVEVAAAIEAGDADGAEARACEQAYFMDLYEVRYFAAIDADWCGRDPTSIGGWDWLADLHPCEE